MVTHLDTNRVWRSATTLIEANALPLSQTAKAGLCDQCRLSFCEHVCHSAYVQAKVIGRFYWNVVLSTKHVQNQTWSDLKNFGNPAPPGLTGAAYNTEFYGRDMGRETNGRRDGQRLNTINMVNKDLQYTRSQSDFLI